MDKTCVLFLVNIMMVSSNVLPRISRSGKNIVKILNKAPLELHGKTFDVDDTPLPPFRKLGNVDNTDIYEANFNQGSRLDKVNLLAKLIHTILAPDNGITQKGLLNNSDNLPKKKSEKSAPQVIEVLAAPEIKKTVLPDDESFDNNGMFFVTAPKEYKETRDFNNLLNKAISYDINKNNKMLRKPDTVFTKNEVEKIKDVVSGLKGDLRSFQGDRRFRFSDLLV